MIQRVEELAKDQRVITDKYPQFEWSPGNPILDDVNEENEPINPVVLNDDVDDNNNDSDRDDGDDTIAINVISHSDSENDLDDNIDISSTNEHSDLPNGDLVPDDGENLSYDDNVKDGTTTVSDADSIPLSNTSVKFHDHFSNEDADDEASSPSDETDEIIDAPSDEVSTSPTHTPNPSPSPSPRRTRPKRKAAGRGVSLLDPSTKGKYYGNTFPHLQFYKHKNQNKIL